MLYNPKWNATSIDNLIAWLEQQPNDGTYDYRSISDCVLAQYFKACGYVRPFVGEARVVEAGTKTYHRFPRSFDWIARAEDRTFGNALERARAVRDCASAP